MDRDIENYVRNCMSCAMHLNEPKPARMHPWEYPQHAWQRLHIDYAGPFLIIVDTYSKWPEVIPMSSTTSRATISPLMSVFVTHGLPVRVVTDNGPQFCSDEFQEFLASNGIEHIRSAPYHPSTNGEAERSVQTFKRNMNCRGALPHSVNFHVHKFLLSYRTTEHSVTGQTPSKMLMNRRIRNKLDLLLPDVQIKQNIRDWKQVEKHHEVDHYEPSTLVMVRSYHTPNKWTPGYVDQALGHMHHNVNMNG